MNVGEVQHDDFLFPPYPKKTQNVDENRGLSGGKIALEDPVLLDRRSITPQAGDFVTVTPSSDSSAELSFRSASTGDFEVLLRALDSFGGQDAITYQVCASM